jgi:hypothetical protein
MPRPKNECKGCTRRSQTCHSTCESYLKYAAELEHIREERLKEYVYDGYHKQCSDKAYRIGRNKGYYK